MEKYTFIKEIKRAKEITNEYVPFYMGSIWWYTYFTNINDDNFDDGNEYWEEQDYIRINFNIWLKNEISKIKRRSKLKLKKYLSQKHTIVFRKIIHPDDYDKYKSDNYEDDWEPREIELKLIMRISVDEYLKDKLYFDFEWE